MKYEDLIALPEEARQEALAKAFNEKNTENQSLRTRLKKESPKALEIFERIKAEFGVDDVDDAFIDSLKSASNKSMSMEERLKAMEKALEREKGEKNQLNEKLTQSEKRQLETERDRVILSEFGRVGIRTDEMQDQIKLAGMVATFDGEAQKWSYNGKDIASYATELAKAKPYLVGNPVKGGQGNSAAPNIGGEAVKDFISEAEYMALTLDQQRTPEIRARARASMDKWSAK